MSLARIEIANIRNLEQVTLEPSPRLNLLIGPNASGKTSLLEAIHLLSRGRSFRTLRVDELIRRGQTALTVAGRVAPRVGSTVPVGLRIARGNREMHVAGRVVQSSLELLRVFPLVVIQPASIELLEGPPRLRRQFLDFGVFHGTADYIDGWRRYTRALSQRNILLREKRLGELAPWTHELARYGTIIGAVRQRYVERLEPVFRETAERFFAGMSFELQPQQGWAGGVPLETVLEQEIESDCRYGYTQSGPHKGDFSVKFEGRPVKAHLSRGQIKLLGYALLLAQSQLLEQQAGRSGCVLIDDVASELDEGRRQRLLDHLRDGQTQYFITATGRAAVEEAIDGHAAVFLVEDGRVTLADDTT